MQTRLLFAAVLAATPILALSPVAFPASDDPGCVSPSAGARQMQRRFMSLMRRRDDEADRILGEHGVPHVRPHEVKQVSDDLVCEKAAYAYAAVLAQDSAGNVHIVHVGGRFLVADADQSVALTFDSTFTRPLAAVRE